MVLFGYVFLALALFICGFQIALACGAPLGEFTMGGRYPGSLPGSMRAAALLQIVVLFGFTAIVLSRSGIAFGFLHGASRIGIWVVFAFFIPGSILNLFSPSKKERLLMGPLNIVALFSTLMVAIQ